MELNIDEIVYSIEKNGYFIIKNYYSSEQCQQILNDIKNISPNSIQNGAGNDLRMCNFENISLGAHKFLHEPFLLNIGNNVLGKKVDKIKKRCQLGILNYHNGNECSGGGWHVDSHKPQFKALLYLTHVNLNNGPFAIICPPLKSKDYKPVSSLEHSWGVRDLDTRFPDKIEEDYKDNIKYLTGNMGDVIVVNTQNIHRGTTIKQGQRISLTNYYYDN
jgi:hypothetical protein